MAVDPTMRQLVGGRAREHTAASSSQMGRFETEVLTQQDNLKALTDLSGQWIDTLRHRKPDDRIILDGQLVVQIVEILEAANKKKFGQVPNLGILRIIADDVRRRSFIWEIPD